MDIFHSVFAARLVFSLGVMNLILVVLLFSTCRCLATSRIGVGLMKRNWYQHYYKYHCYLWWVLATSVIVHAVFAVGLMGIPF